MTSHSLPSLNKLDRLWVTEAIRLREEYAGPLEDAEANRQARQAKDLPSMIQHRALWLARRDALLDSLNNWRQSIRLTGIFLALLALFTGIGLGIAALGDSHQPVNVFWALGSLLGLNLLALMIWLLGLALNRRFKKSTGGLLGRFWLWLAARLARDDRATLLMRALLSLLRQNNLTRWLLGTATHSLWLIALGSALLTLLILLATRRYGFIWETTILSEDTFVFLTQALGALPSLLGFQVPSLEQIRLSGVVNSDLEFSRQVWASWLTGMLIVYGVLPRLLLGIFCYSRWRCGRRRIQLNLSLPAYRLLADRLQPTSERLGVNDPAPAQLPTPGTGNRPISGAGAILVGIELDDRLPWPPESLPETIADAGVLDDRAQRRQLLETMTQTPPARLVVACDPRRSPDRGTLNLITELSHCAAQTRLWLLPAPAGEVLDRERVNDWNEALERLGIPYASNSPLNWLEHGHD